MVFGITRQPVHPTIASHELRLRIQKHDIKSRHKERKAREKYERELTKAQIKHQAELHKIRQEEKEHYRSIYERARA